MNYILMCLAVLAVCLICAWLPARWISKKRALSRAATLIVSLIFSILLVFGAAFGYLSVYNHADDSTNVTVPLISMQKIKGGYFFDGPGEDCALIFYPGAKVETTAYAPLMSSLAERGVDCFLADMPYRMAIFKPHQADIFSSTHSYAHWFAAGHSMGGLMISSQLSAHPDQFDGLILLASYPRKPIPDNIPLCSIYGTLDGCLNRSAYDKARKYWPPQSCEHLLECGNHAQFGNYGQQSGDHEATITRDEQQTQTVNLILDFVSQNMSQHSSTK